MAYFLGVDQGSNSSRAVLFDGNGDVIETAAQKVSVIRDSAGHVEHDGCQLLDSVRDVIGRILSGLAPQQLEQVQACGIATQRSTALAWHNSGRVLGPALSWQDVRAREQLDELRPFEPEIRRLTGLPLSAYYSATKLGWLLHELDSVQPCDHAELRLSPLISYLLFHLLESRPYITDYGNAQRTQLFDLESLDWSERLCRLFGIERRLLPQCVPMCAHHGTLLDTQIPVTAVCGDQNAAIFGTGALGPGVAQVNIGSGAFVLRKLERLSASHSQLTGIAYADSQDVSYMREATINGAGNALSWAEQQWQLDHVQQQLPGWLLEVEQPPVFINTIGGLGTPWMRGDIPPTFIAEGDYTDAEKAVAVIESIVFMIQLNLELMQVESPLRGLRASGGLSQLDGLCQKLSNLSGLVLERSHVIEATARGAAWLAAGRPDNWNHAGGDAATASRGFTPRPDRPLQQRYLTFKTHMQRIFQHHKQGAGES
jgi:glycerol kinase